MPESKASNSETGKPSQRRPEVTSKDVAKAAGVSQATVSRVLQNHPRVAPATRQKVMKAVEKTGYMPNLLARAMRTQSTGTIGVVVDRITNPFYPEVVEALAIRLSRADRRMILWTSDGAGEAGALEAIQQGLVDGLVFTTVTGVSSPLSEAKKRGAPMVLVNRGLDDLDCDQVMSDNVPGAASVARYFRQWQREPVGFIGGPQNASTATERESGFFDRSGAKVVVPREFHERGDYSHRSAYEAALRILRHDRRPSAIFCVNDLMAMGAVDAARALDINLPADLWIVGYDDIDMASWESYDLTTVNQPIGEMVDRSIALLMERIDHPGKSSERVRFPSKLIVRGSSENRPFDPNQ